MENLNYSAIIKAILNVAFAHFQLHIVERCECLPSEISDLYDLVVSTVTMQWKQCNDNH